ncbi:ABC-2 type transport system permease protein [Nocardia amikacinitolerans]|uniref:ABC-2 type transport system permease protein n=1 Tax=Nocardia amikacinitolerans TaxID=756689 RepID=A0A285KYU3_9NOCA|nr:polyketide antibiotic transporter [Nocardia amikacinitolerans]SNY77820.1 ABC-2 type transport system permease protein [Nocardia amikacinitolerans]
MTATTVRPQQVNVSAPGRAAARLTRRQARRGAAIVALTATGLSALVAAQYRTTFADSIDAGALRALAENPAVRILFGTPLALDDPGGFTVWRTGTPVVVLCGMWALLAATRLTRGEEDAGHWDLLLGGRLRPIDLVARCATTLCLAAAVIATGVAAGLVVTGTDPTGALLHGLCVFGATVAFASVGLLAAQLLPSRAAAAGLASAVLGASLLLRMLADGVPPLAWTAWLTPFGLAARVAPYADNRIEPLFVLAVLAIVPAAAALVAARGRDLGGALITLSDTRPARTRLLGSVLGFAVRRAVAPTAGWGVGIAAYFLLVGALISSILEFFAENPRFAELAATAGFGGLDTATGFAAAMFALLAIPAGLYAATRITTFAADETARRWTALHALPLTRARSAGTEIAVTAAGLAVLLLAAAVAMWVGAVLTGAPLSLPEAIAGAANVAPLALLALGAAALALGWFPSAVGPIGAVPVVGGFLLDILAQSTGAPSWAREISPFAHLAAVPDTAPDWTANLTFAAIAIATTTIGLYGYTRRDLRG